jgi:hypothetical protein
MTINGQNYLVAIFAVFCSSFGKKKYIKMIVEKRNNSPMLVQMVDSSYTVNVKALTPAVISEQVILTLEYLLGSGTSAIIIPWLAASFSRSIYRPN